MHHQSTALTCTNSADQAIERRALNATTDQASHAGELRPVSGRLHDITVTTGRPVHTTATHPGMRATPVLTQDDAVARQPGTGSRTNRARA